MATYDPLVDPLPESLLPREEWYEVYLRYGLYVGAAFQLACILAVLVLPSQSGKDGEEQDDVSFMSCSQIRFAYLWDAFLCLLCLCVRSSSA